MTNFKGLTIWTITLSFFIIIGAGHGIACIGLLEIVGLFHKFNIGTEDFSISLSATYDKSLSAVAFFSLVGHIFLIASLLTKNHKQMFWTKNIGLLFLWVSFYYLTHNSFTDSLSQIGFFTGFPFLIVSIILFFRVAKQKYQSVYD